jgi:hypothetical protein
MPINHELLVGSILSGLAKGVNEGIQFRAELGEKQAAREQAAALESRKLDIDQQKANSRSTEGGLIDLLRLQQIESSKFKNAIELENISNKTGDDSLRIQEAKSKNRDKLSEIDRQMVGLQNAKDQYSIAERENLASQKEEILSDQNRLKDLGIANQLKADALQRRTSFPNQPQPMQQAAPIMGSPKMEYDKSMNLVSENIKKLQKPEDILAFKERLQNMLQSQYLTHQQIVPLVQELGNKFKELKQQQIFNNKKQTDRILQDALMPNTGIPSSSSPSIEEELLGGAYK